jgi:hypothetical protein
MSFFWSDRKSQLFGVKSLKCHILSCYNLSFLEEAYLRVEILDFIGCFANNLLFCDILSVNLYFQATFKLYLFPGMIFYLLFVQSLLKIFMEVHLNMSLIFFLISQLTVLNVITSNQL